jgi:hypothetical protein
MKFAALVVLAVVLFYIGLIISSVNRFRAAERYKSLQLRNRIER